MARLLTLDQAKTHLRVEDDAHNADIDLKLVQASDLVVDYLKTRSNAIASVSVASPTVVTTVTPHSLVSGTTATLAGTSTTPTVNGAQVVTVTGPLTFTVPVAVTVGQSTEAGTVDRAVWTAATVPGPVQAAVLLMLTHLYEHRGDDMLTDARLWEAVGRLVIRFRDPAYA